MLAGHLQLRVESKTECPFLMYRLFVKIKHLPLLSTINLPLVEFLHTLTAIFYTFSIYKFGTVYTLAFRCLPICSSWTKLHDELVCLKKIILKMATQKILSINLQKTLWITYCSKRDYSNS